MQDNYTRFAILPRPLEAWRHLELFLIIPYLSCFLVALWTLLGPSLGLSWAHEAFPLVSRSTIWYRAEVPGVLVYYLLSTELGTPGTP